MLRVSKGDQLFPGLQSVTSPGLLVSIGFRHIHATCRDKHREELLAQRRQIGPPRVICIVPLSQVNGMHALEDRNSLNWWPSTCLKGTVKI